MSYQLVVGDKDCTFKAVVDTMRSVATFDEDLDTNLALIAKDLAIKPIDVTNLKRKYAQRDINPISLEELFHDVLTKWRSAQSSKATLNALVQVLRDRSLNELARALEEKFGIALEKKSDQKEKSGGKSQVTNINPVSVQSSKVTTGKLKFDKTLSVKNDVLVKLTPEILSVLNNNRTNTDIIMQLTALGVYEPKDVEGILISKYDNETDRMLAFLDVIGNCDDDHIVQCLEYLCFLKNMRIKSEKIRKILIDAFPNCFD